MDEDTLAKVSPPFLSDPDQQWKELFSSRCTDVEQRGTLSAHPLTSPLFSGLLLLLGS